MPQSPPAKLDPLVVQHLKLPQSVIDAFRVMAESDHRTITWQYRQVLQEAADKYVAQLAAEKKLKMKKGGR